MLSVVHGKDVNYKLHTSSCCEESTVVNDKNLVVLKRRTKVCNRGS